jgi:hypothetical protein
MSTNELEIHNGPDKAELLRAVANPDKHLHVMFETPAEAVEAHIDIMEEITTDGSAFGLLGHFTSGNLRGAVFTGTYNVSSRSGRLVLKRAKRLQ